MAEADFTAELKRFADQCATQTQAGADARLRRKLFGEYASLWNRAEAAKDQTAMDELVSLRPQLKQCLPRAGALQKASMMGRLFLTIFVACFGCVCLMPVAALRLAHPFLRKLGIQNGRLPADIGLYLWGRAVLAAMGIKVRLNSDAASIWGKNSCGIIAFNHASNLDPFIVNLVCQAYAPKYVGKKSLFKLPLFGWIMLLTGMVPINRGDRQKAIHTMNKLVGDIMKKWGRCVAISPEGTRCTDGHLTLPFKKGAFHLQSLTSRPIMPVVIFGAYELWPPKQVFTNTGEVVVEILPAQLSDTSEMPEGNDAARVRLQRCIAEYMAQRPERSAMPLSLAGWLENMFVLTCTGAVFWMNARFYARLYKMLGFTRRRSAALFATATLSIACYVDRM